MAVAQPNGKRRRMCTMDDELFELLIRLMVVAEFAQNSATFVGAAVASTRRPSGDNGSFWQSSSKYSAIMEVPHYWTADQVGRLLDALAAHNRHQARTAVLIMWRTGLRVGEVLELEWRDLDYWGRPATLLVRKSKSRRARMVRLHGALAWRPGAAVRELAVQPVPAGQGCGPGDADDAAAHR